MKKIILFLLFFTTLLGERPKIGLVLSGGGGKGFSHIGVLRVFERENIPIDYITGTSIGSIIGLLYSIGYTVDELEEIVEEIDWDSIFIDTPERTDIPMEEKLFSERYFLTLPIENGEIKLPMGLISGQKVYMTLKKYTWEARGIKKFDNLPIPFRAVATNLSNGEVVVLDGGDIAKALNASMAIPSFFRPVKWDDIVLTDGLSSKNLPVDEIKEMGADIVIGVDIGAPLSDVNDLTFLGVLNQVQAFRGHDSTAKQRLQVDYLIEPNISTYSPIDFSKKEELIALGEWAAIENLPDLKKLKNNKQVINRKSLILNLEVNSKALINSVEIRGLNKVEDTLIFSLIGKELPFITDQYKLDDKIKLMYALGLFERIYYDIVGDKLLLTFEEKTSNNLTFGLNYSSLDGINNASITLGTTLNSFGIAGSKTKVDLSVSQFPTIRATNFIYYGFGPFRKIGLISNVGYNRDWTFNYDSKGFSTTNIKLNELSLDLFVGSILGKKFISGFGSTFESIAYEDVEDSEMGKEDIISLYFKSTYDSYNKVNYPNEGAYINFEMRGSPESFNTRNKFEFSTFDFLGSKSISLNEKLSLSGTFALESSIGEEIPRKYKTTINGINFERDKSTFYGMRSGGQEVKAYALIKFSLQYELFKNFYGTLISNSVSYKDREEILGVHSGYGIGVGYDSFIGPIDFVITNDAIDKKGALFHFNLGYRF